MESKEHLTTLLEQYIWLNQQSQIMLARLKRCRTQESVNNTEDTIRELDARINACLKEFDALLGTD